MIPLNQNLSGLRRSAIRVYTNLAAATPGCIKLTLGEPDMDTPANIRAAASAALEAGQTHYAPNQGTPELRRAISEYETARGNAVTGEQVLVTIGATQALYTVLTGILNPGEEVIIPTPGFVLYESIVLAAGGRPVFLDVSRTDFQITGQALAAVISPKTKAIVLNSPNNPTGVVLNGQSIAAVKGAVLGKPIFVICDNVYNLLCDGDAPDLSLDEELREQVLVCQSFSKPWAMTGWRVGYLTAPAYVMDRLLLLSAAEIASVPTFVQAAAVEALRTDPGPLADTFRRRREYVTGRLKSMGLPFPEPRGAFYVFPDIRQFGMTSDEFCTRMIREAGVAAVPGSCFGAEGYIRISCCCSDENLREGLDRMEHFLTALPHCAR
ncbi:MAG: aminotransferase class I/II-fold pyridoxal phosphate-dependent enzyme [Candidatus Faecousia sp.]|nr:aminotransferase class I/II-fold pyridoxal phosphate-dependent enzyme [Candidatus Faecousia sp.]